MAVRKILSDNDVNAIIKALGLKEGDSVVFYGPSFDRAPGEPAPADPPTAWESLKTLSDQTLHDLGLKPWGPIDEKKPNRILWLFPKEWFAHIPTGFEVTSIFGDSAPFSSEKHDDDTRFGMLAFGIVKEED